MKQKKPPKKALIISPESWGKMRISKHHYAIELAKNGYEVFFLEPLVADWRVRSRRFDCSGSNFQGLHVVSQSISFPYNVKFHLQIVYSFLMRYHIRSLEREFGPFDLVWSYDLNDSIPLRFFSSGIKKIFFAADWPQSQSFVRASEGADLIVSVAKEILELYLPEGDAGRLLLQHGVAPCFIEAAKLPFNPSSDRIKVGMTGNLLRPDIDRVVLLQIISTHHSIDFELYGPFSSGQSNLGCDFDEETELFIEKLRSNTNVTLHGVVTPEELAMELREIDVFLICYDASRDQSKATNYHKVTEFLAYGRPIIANRISAHIGNSMVIQTANANGVVDVAQNFQRFIASYHRKTVFEDSIETHSYADNLKIIMTQLQG
jgi:hypothetical protein